jgi:hypothetical protein
VLQGLQIGGTSGCGGRWSQGGNSNVEIESGEDLKKRQSPDADKAGKQEADMREC